MKKIFNLALTALIVFGAASCSKEIDNGLENGAAGNTALRFNIKTGNKGSLVSRAIAEGDQMMVKTVDVYAWYEGSGGETGKKLVSGTDYTITGTDTEKTITATAAFVNEIAGNTVNFYFVANDAESFSGAHIAALPATEVEFKESLTNSLTASAGKYEVIKGISEGTNLLLMSEVASIQVAGTKVERDIKLYRRDARFDLKQTPNIDIEKVYVSDARMQAYVFSTAAGSPDGRATGDHEAIDCTGLTYDATTLMATSAFHLYPTVIGTAAGQTRIVIEDSNGKLYNLAGTMEIKANFRYILSLEPSGLINVIEAEDYEEGDGGITVEPGTGTLAIVAPAIADITNGTFNPQYTSISVTDPTLAFEANLVALGSSEEAGNITAEVISVPGAGLIEVGSDVITVTAPAYDGNGVVMTRAMGKGHAFTVSFEAGAIEADKNFKTIIRLTNTETKATADVTVFYNGADMLNEIKEDLQITDDKLAEAVIDALAQLPDGSTVNDITVLDVSGAEGPASLEGIENMPNLTEINANGNASITEIDLSGNPALTNVNLSNTAVTELDLTGNPNLEYVYLNKTGLSELDLSNNQSLKVLSIQFTDITDIVFPANNTSILELHLQSNNNLTSIDITGLHSLQKLFLDHSQLDAINTSNNTELLFLDIRNTPITVLDLANNEKLETLQVGGYAGTFDAALTSVDITNNKAITTFRCAYVPYEFTVYVWSDFPANPESQFTTYQITGTTTITYVPQS